MKVESNPILRDSIKQGMSRYRGMAQDTDTSSITPQDVVNKSLILLGVILFSAVPTYGAVMTGLINPLIPLAVGGFGGFIVVMIAAFKKQMNNPAFALIYSGLEGLFLGSATYVIAGTSIGSRLGSAEIIFGAVVATMTIFAIMLALYRSGFIKVNNTFIVVVSAITLGIAAVSLLSFGLSFFGMGLGLRSATAMGIAFSLFCIVMAALNFCIDFKNIDTLVEARASKEYAWGAAFGLVITLVWLYIEILILIRNLTSSN